MSIWIICAQSRTTAVVTYSPRSNQICTFPLKPEDTSLNPFAMYGHPLLRSLSKDINLCPGFQAGLKYSIVWIYYNLPPGHNGGKITDHNVKYWNFVSLIVLLKSILGVGWMRGNHWFTKRLRAEQTTSHSLNQWWSSSVTHICGFRGWVNKDCTVP